MSQPVCPHCRGFVVQEDQDTVCIHCGWRHVVQQIHTNHGDGNGPYGQFAPGSKHYRHMPTLEEMERRMS